MIDWAFQRQTTMHTMYVRSMERWQGRDYEKQGEGRFRYDTFREKIKHWE